MSREEGFLAKGFRAVDANPDVDKFASCLRFMKDMPFFKAYKNRSFEMMALKPDQIAVDLGCGLGFDVRALASFVAPGGKAIGVDSSEKFLEAARKECMDAGNAEFVCCDIHKLKFGSDTIDSIRIDRTLQHVENPQFVIAEMARVLKSDGWLVCAEPDWDTFVIDSSDVDTIAIVLKKWRSGFRNPNIGRQLFRRIRGAGLREVHVEGFVHVTHGLEAINTVYDVHKTVNLLQEESPADADRLSKWLNDLSEADKKCPLTASLTLFLAAGRK